MVGFILTLSIDALYGFIIPLIELTYKSTKHQIMYVLVMEMQFRMSFLAIVFYTVGMLINGDFQALHREAKEFGVGKIDYSIALQWIAIA